MAPCMMCSSSLNEGDQHYLIDDMGFEINSILENNLSSEVRTYFPN